MKLRYLALGIALLATPVHAHDAKGPHGGHLVDAGPYHAELVTAGKAVEVFLTGESGKAVDLGGFKGTAIFALGGKAERVALVPSEKGALSGEAAADLPPRPKGVVQVTAPDGKTATARFD